jgi:hypothetical protein
MGGSSTSSGFGLGFLPFPNVSRNLVVWLKGRIIPGWDAAAWRYDSFGSVMYYGQYGQTTEFGWEIDHIDPDGPDEIWNLQPLNWLNNRRKSDKSQLMAALEALTAAVGRK